MDGVRVFERSRQVGRRAAAELTKQTAALADRLEAGVSKRALAEAVAGKEALAGLIDGRTPAQVEADLMARLRRYEEVAALRRAGNLKKIKVRRQA